MPRNLHLVYSSPPPEITDEEFNGWYDPHLDEILVVPGFVSAQRYKLEPAVTHTGSTCLSATCRCTRWRETPPK